MPRKRDVQIPVAVRLVAAVAVSRLPALLEALPQPGYQIIWVALHARAIQEREYVPKRAQVRLSIGDEAVTVPDPGALHRTPDNHLVADSPFLVGLECPNAPLMPWAQPVKDFLDGFLQQIGGAFREGGQRAENVFYGQLGEITLVDLLVEFFLACLGHIGGHARLLDDVLPSIAEDVPLRLFRGALQIGVTDTTRPEAVQGVQAIA